MTDWSDKGFCYSFNKMELDYDTKPICERCGMPMVDYGSWVPYGNTKIYNECWDCDCLEKDYEENENGDEKDN
jgi:hypothetical protein